MPFETVSEWSGGQCLSKNTLPDGRVPSTPSSFLSITSVWWELVDWDIELAPLRDCELAQERARALCLLLHLVQDCVFVHSPKDVYFKSEAQTTFLLSGLPALRPSSGSPTHRWEVIERFSAETSCDLFNDLFNIEQARAEAQRQAGRLLQ